jgi:hypothetical protein
VLPNDRNGLGGCNIVAGNSVEFVRGAVEVFLNDLLSAGETVSAAHGQNYGRLSGSFTWGGVRPQLATKSWGERNLRWRYIPCGDSFWLASR